MNANIELTKMALQILGNKKFYCKSDIVRHICLDNFPEMKGKIGRLQNETSQIFDVREQRSKNKMIAPFVDREMLRKSFLHRISEHLEKIYPLAVGENRWAQIDNSFHVHHCHATPEICVYSDRTYSSNGKWGGNSYGFHLHFNAINQKIEKIGGLLTVTNKSDKSRSKVCWWFEQSRGKEVKTVEGFLVRGYHIKKSKSVDTLEKAIKKVQAQRDKTAKQIREKRFWKRLSAEEITQKLQTVWITETDSIAAGNCPAGTRNFKERYQRKNNYGDVGAVRGDELINQANGDIYFIRRIFAHKFGIAV